MARIRTIKPEFWEDEKVGKLPIPCRLFFIGCWNFADDYGVIKGNAALLKSQIFPYDENLRVSEIKKWLNALVEARMLIPIILDDENQRPAEESYYLIRTFRSHQVLDKRYNKSYISKDETFVKMLINNTLSKHHVNTTSTPREHHVNTLEEKEMEKERIKKNSKKELKETFSKSLNSGSTNLDVYTNYISESKQDQNWLDIMCMNFHVNVQTLTSYMDEFRQDCLCRGADDRNKTLRDFKQHFNNWLRIRICNEIKNNNEHRQSNGAAATREQRQAEAAQLVAEILARDNK